MNVPLVDAHAHVFTIDMPLRDKPRHRPSYSFTIEQYLEVLDKHGVRMAVLAAASPWHDYNDYLIDSVACHPRLRGTVIVEPDVERIVLRDMAEHGIVGGQAPLGTGLAYAVKYKGLKGCCLAYMGDGAVNQGAVHEAYNLAALWSLPCIFVIENNGYSMGTSQARSSAGELAKRAEGYGMAWDVINGHDVYEVRAKTSEALKRAHEESKPTVLEIFTYRYYGHSMADPDKTYRDKEEIKEYREKKDPVLLFEQELLREKVLTPESAQKINDDAMAEADKARKIDTADINIPPGPRLGDVVLEASHLTKGFEDRVLWKIGRAHV